MSVQLNAPPWRQRSRRSPGAVNKLEPGSREPGPGVAGLAQEERASPTLSPPGCEPTHCPLLHAHSSTTTRLLLRPSLAIRESHSQQTFKHTCLHHHHHHHQPPSRAGLCLPGLGLFLGPSTGTAESSCSSGGKLT